MKTTPGTQQTLKHKENRSLKNSTTQLHSTPKHQPSSIKFK